MNISVKNLTKVYGNTEYGVRALNNVSFEIYDIKNIRDYIKEKNINICGGEIINVIILIYLMHYNYIYSKNKE